MRKIGLTSITFRQLKWEEIIDVVVKNQIDGIEWGADVHILPGDSITAQKVKEACRQNDIEIFSYGSYYKVCQGLDPKKDFEPILTSAKVLEAPVVRVWAGRTASKDVTEEFYQQVADELREMCDLAKEKGIEVALEYHRKSLTDTAESTLKLLSLVNRENLFTYWQSNPELSVEDNKREIKQILPYLKYVHVFHWLPDNTKLPLEEGKEIWKEYIELLKDTNYIFEHVIEDSVNYLEKDVESLKELLKR